MLGEYSVFPVHFPMRKGFQPSSPWYGLWRRAGRSCLSSSPCFLGLSPVHYRLLEARLRPGGRLYFPVKLVKIAGKMPSSP